MGASEVRLHLEVRCETIRRRILNLRAVERYLKSDEFEEVYFSSTANLRREVESYIDSDNLDKIRKWVSVNKKKDLESRSYRELRDLAKLHNIYLWSRLDKDGLVEALRGVLIQPS